MRILVLSNKCPPDYDGGYELSAFQVAGALRGRGYEVDLATSHFRPTYHGERDDPPWVHRIFQYLEWPKLTKSGAGRWLEDAGRVADLTNVGVSNALALAQFLIDKKYDLAYCFGLHGIGLATAHPLAKDKVPILWHAGNYLIAQDLQLRSLFSRRRLMHRVAMHLMATKAKRMIFEGDYSHIAFLSEAMRKEFVSMGYEPEHSYIIPRGIDFPLATLKEPRQPEFFMASRISEEKGYDIALDAAGLLAKQTPDLSWELRIAGSGRPDYIEHLKAKARNAGIEKRVHFLGMRKRDEVLAQMRHAWAFISASLWEEPFGRTNIESLACGAALIAADTGAIREIVGDSGCARIYAKNDSAALAQNMQEVLTSPAARDDLASRGLQRIQDAYTMDRILDMTEDVFAKVLADYGKPFAKPSLKRSSV